MIRSGTHDLRIETGRWNGTPPAARTCRFCAMNVLEDEVHILLDCYVFEREREKMKNTIERDSKRFLNLQLMWQEREWLVQVLLGGGIFSKRYREIINRAVIQFWYESAN